MSTWLSEYTLGSYTNICLTLPSDQFLQRLNPLQATQRAVCRGPPVRIRTSLAKEPLSCDWTDLMEVKLSCQAALGILLWPTAMVAWKGLGALQGSQGSAAGASRL